MNTMNINGFEVIIQYDSDINMFRGEFLGLNGGADFYADNVDDLRQEGGRSLKVFMDMCEEKGIDPRKKFSGKFTLRVTPDFHKKLAIRATSSGESINKWIKQTLKQAIDSED